MDAEHTSLLRTICHSFSYIRDRLTADEEVLDITAEQCMQVEYAAQHLVQAHLCATHKEAVYLLYDALYLKAHQSVQDT